MNRYVMDRLMRDNRGNTHRNNGEFASDRDYYGRGRDGRNSGGYGRDYSDRSYDRDYRRDRDYRSDRDYNFDRRDHRDKDYRNRRDRDYSDSYDDYENRQDFEYNSGEIELNEKDIKRWAKELQNANGTRGARFTKEQIIPIAYNNGVKFDEFTEQEFAMTVNMLYSDFCEAFHKAGIAAFDKPEIYVQMAKAWLCDEDFEGEPYEKLAMYYYAIVDFEE